LVGIQWVFANIVLVFVEISETFFDGGFESGEWW